MKIFFEDKTLIIQSENYTENIALDAWGSKFFAKVNLNKNMDEPYYLLISSYTPKGIPPYEQK